MGVNSLPKTVTRQRRGCDLNPGPSAHESSTLTTRLPSHPEGIKAGRNLFTPAVNQVTIWQSKTVTVILIAWRTTISLDSLPFHLLPSTTTLGVAYHYRGAERQLPEVWTLELLYGMVWYGKRRFI